MWVILLSFSLLGAATDEAPPPAAVMETVVVTRSEAGELRRSPYAVRIVTFERARQEASDVGDVLARTEGVGVQRQGGLGSEARLSLNGLTDDQIRIFIDGVPLEFSGYATGLASVPVNFIERVDIFSGVVPIRFGADALGGVLDVVTRRKPEGFAASLSYQLGSYDTARLTAGVDVQSRDTGAYARLRGFYDSALNDYLISVQAANAKGKLSTATVRRFHDKYAARGVGIEVGVADRSWAKLLSMSAFVSDLHKDIQHNKVMTQPYGEVTSTKAGWGLLGRYRLGEPGERAIDVAMGYGFSTTHFLDVGAWVYDWYGRQTQARTLPGETDSQPHDRSQWQDAVFMRALGDWRLTESQLLQLAIAPTYSLRQGHELRLPTPISRDPLAGNRAILSEVTGLALISTWPYALDSIVFVKSYVYHDHTHDIVYGKEPRTLDSLSAPLGGGAMLRWDSGLGFAVKGSYEYTSRIPTPDQLFGDTMLVLANPDLAPEKSHNANLGIQTSLRFDGVGRLSAEAVVFLRETRDLIVELSNDKTSTYENVDAARSVGAQGNVAWHTPYARVDASATWQDFRNTSSSGPYAPYTGDRVPNRPYLFVNAALRLIAPHEITHDNELSVAWYARYVHQFYRGWESQGLTAYKQTVDAQLWYTAAMVWSATWTGVRASLAVQVDNVTNASIFDVFGVQRPGRSFYCKGSFDY